jgi:outer membrane protein TolC
MANNTDVQIQFLTVEQPKNAIQAALGAFDPLARASFNTNRTTSFVTSPSAALDASPVGSALKSLSQPANLTVSQTLSNGTQYSASYGLNKTSSSAVTPRSYNVGLWNSNMAFTITQPLLRNRGTYVNRIPVMQAQNSVKVAEFQLRNQLLTLVNTAEGAYWNVVSARERLRVQETARDAAKTYLDFMQQQLDLGALSPLDIYNPKQALAAAEVSVSQARFDLLQAEDALRRQIAVDLDPEVRKLPLELTEPVELGTTPTYDREEMVQRGLTSSPALASVMQRLEGDDLGIQSARNGLLPNLAFNASYQSTGRGGAYTTGDMHLLPGGFGDAFGQMFGFSYPVYSAGLTLTLPIRSRTASATMANAVVQKKSDALTVRTTQQAVRLQILNAVTALEGAKEQLKLAETQANFAKLNEEAAQEKYRLGTETNQNVVFAQRDKATADLAVVNAQISVRRAVLNVLTQTGELLDDRGIVVK